MVLVKYIDTDLWHKVIDLLISKNWQVTYAYDGMDAGIDYNCYKVRMGAEEIVFEWTNWDEGDLRCTPERLREIEKLIGQEFKIVLATSMKLPGAPDYSAPRNQPNSK